MRTVSENINDHIGRYFNRFSSFKSLNSSLLTPVQVLLSTQWLISRRQQFWHKQMVQSFLLRNYLLHNHLLQKHMIHNTMHKSDCPKFWSQSSSWIVEAHATVDEIRLESHLPVQSRWRISIWGIVQPEHGSFMMLSGLANHWAWWNVQAIYWCRPRPESKDLNSCPSQSSYPSGPLTAVTLFLGAIMILREHQPHI